MHWAAENGKSTIEMTTGGQWLDSADLFGQTGPAPFSRQRAGIVWDKASRRFAEGVSGDVNAFTAGTATDLSKIFYGIELPTIRANRAWSRRIIYRGY
jgi:hypothetical protein